MSDSVSREAYLTMEGKFLAAETAARGYRERAERADAALKESISSTNKCLAAWTEMRAERDDLIVERDDLILELDDYETQTQILEERAYLSGRHVGGLQMVDLLAAAHAERDTLKAERDALEGKFLAAEKTRDELAAYVARHGACGETRHHGRRGRDEMDWDYQQDQQVVGGA